MAALNRWGPNKFEVPIPKFQSLLAEQLLAPFFCFQVFCVGLWALDEYWCETFLLFKHAAHAVFVLCMLNPTELSCIAQQLNLKNNVSQQQSIMMGALLKLKKGDHDAKTPYVLALPFVSHEGKGLDSVCSGACPAQTS